MVATTRLQHELDATMSASHYRYTLARTNCEILVHDNIVGKLESIIPIITQRQCEHINVCFVFQRDSILWKPSTMTLTEAISRERCKGYCSSGAGIRFSKVKGGIVALYSRRNLT